MPKRSVREVAATRAAVLDAAVGQASVEGFEGLTIGRLADRTELSKSGLFGLFGSKTELQRRTLEAGMELFVDEVWTPVARRKAGRRRLLALCDRWLAFLESDTLPGGCLMTTAAVEFDARPGTLHNAAAEGFTRWLALLERDVQTAVTAGELPPDTNAASVAYELNAFASAASWRYRLLGDPQVFALARASMRRTLAAV